MSGEIMAQKADDQIQHGLNQQQDFYKKFDEILKVCEGNEQFMWSAKIISIILDCDFRDAKAELAKRNWG